MSGLTPQPITHSENVDLRDAENPEPHVGWADDTGQIVARARMRRTESAYELVSITTSDVEAGAEMMRTIAEVANAPRIVTSLSEPWLSERCGFVDGVLDLRPEVAERAAVVAFTLADVEAAITSSWCVETSPLLWTEDNPARGQCDVTALVVRELLGGSIVCCNVVLNGQRVERHAWNVA